MAEAQREFALTVIGVGNLRVSCKVLEFGRVRYVVRGPRLRGTFVVVPHCVFGGPLLPRLVRVQFGDGLQPINKYRARDAEPVVNGITLGGGTNAVDPARLPRWFDLASDAAGRGTGDSLRRLPDGAHQRTSLLVAALIRLWYSRPDRGSLVRAAAARYAAEFAEDELRAAGALRYQLAELREEQLRGRRLVNQINGVLRRRPLPVQEVQAAPVRLPFFDRLGRRLGDLTVRERAVNRMPGVVEYDVEGGRVRGVFSVGPDRYGGGAVPGGLYVYYGRPRSTYGHDYDDEPTVNGVQLSFGWCTSYPDEITATAPADLPASIRTGPTTSQSAPGATARRASGALRALALHYLDRSDLAALRLAAGKSRGAESLVQARNHVRRLKGQADKKRSQMRRHERRAEQYLALLQGAAESTAALGQVASVQNLEESWSTGNRQLGSVSTSSGPLGTPTELFRAA